MIEKWTFHPPLLMTDIFLQTSAPKDLYVEIVPISIISFSTEDFALKFL